MLKTVIAAIGSVYLHAEQRWKTILPRSRLRGNRQNKMERDMLHCEVLFAFHLALTFEGIMWKRSTSTSSFCPLSLHQWTIRFPLAVLAVKGVFRFIVVRAWHRAAHILKYRVNMGFSVQGIRHDTVPKWGKRATPTIAAVTYFFQTNSFTGAAWWMPVLSPNCAVARWRRGRLLAQSIITYELLLSVICLKSEVPYLFLWSPISLPVFLSFIMFMSLFTFLALGYL